jgi:mlo protein
MQLTSNISLPSCLIFAELMVLGFISLLLTFGQSYISRICIPVKAADTMLPCPLRDGSHYQETEPHNEPQKGEGEHHRKLLWYARRYLAAEGGGAACKPVRILLTKNLRLGRPSWLFQNI